MANILDYIKWRGDLSFTQDPPNAVDALVFSSLSYICYGGAAEEDPHNPITLRSAAEQFFTLADHEQRVRVQSDLELLHLAAGSVRFGFSKIFDCFMLNFQMSSTRNVCNYPFYKKFAHICYNI